MPDQALRIALIGAESTGKTALAQALMPRIQALTGLSCTWVPESLRIWCDTMGRTPRREEQAAIAASQQEAIDAAARRHAVVLCDTTPLMVAVYSQLIFGDVSLIAAALAWHQSCAATLLMALDLPWVADGWQRDGAQVRAPVDTLLRELLVAHRLPWSVVGGSGDARCENAIDALAPLLRLRLAVPGATTNTTASTTANTTANTTSGATANTPTNAQRGLFSRLDQRNAEATAARWTCESCDDPDCEHREQARQRSAAS